LLAALPEVLRLDTETIATSGVDGLLEVLRAEADDAKPGATAVFAKIADVFLTLALRAFLLTAERSGAVQVGPLQHPAIASAIESMRNDLDKEWSVAQLARAAGMSKTLFVARFTSLVGHAPIRFLTRLRLSQSAGYLTTTNLTIYAIARRVGYETEASFSKAFKREFGVAPGMYRRVSAERPIIVELETDGSRVPRTGP
jgi:transcriptional regulator GlxA family with amidase domain